ncbi:hypothetical protein HanRHA438_Chr15g0728891 [Helianthus annuus]|nr:hypothetical protein HanRHA438_Chr15g0728891 [Helianthus annuus]
MSRAMNSELSIVETFMFWRRICSVSTSGNSIVIVDLIILFLMIV